MQCDDRFWPPPSNGGCYATALEIGGIGALASLLSQSFHILRLVLHVANGRYAETKGLRERHWVAAVSVYVCVYKAGQEGVARLGDDGG